MEIVLLTLEEIKILSEDKLNEYTYKYYNSSQQNLKNYELDYLRKIIQINNLYNKNDKTDLNDYIDTFTKSIDNANKLINKLENDINIYKKQLIFLNREMDDQFKEGCNICFRDDLFNQKISILECGHIFCSTCIRPWIRKNKDTCPKCRSKFSQNLIKYINKDNLNINKKENGIINEIKPPNILINKYGSKIATLIHLINTIQSSNNNNNNIIPKFIVFSQWDKLLKLIGNSLLEEGISNIYCNGNAKSKIKSIELFKNKTDINIIMLSMKNSASGTNLSEANYIIIMDPTIKDIELQAIKRSHRIGQKNPVYVYRLIIKDTLEYDYYCYINQ
jgi:hypothetical protein